MKLLTQLKKYSAQAAIGFTTLSLLTGLALTSPAPVYASSATSAPVAAAPATAESANGEKLNQALQKAYKAEQARLTHQAANLQKAGAGVTRIQNLISQAKTKAIDTSALENALAAFQTALASAQAAHDQAATILNAHAGFASDGGVTDSAAAHKTVTGARQSLKDAATSLGQSVKDLAASVKTWRAASKAILQGQALDKAFANEQTALTRQSANLDKSTTAAGKAQTLIDLWSAKGADVSFLQGLLSAFNAHITAARTAHTTASAILTSHAGFDAAGHPTAIDQAKQTVQSARQALRSAASSLGQAFKDLSAGLKTWRTQHQPAPGK